MHYAFANGTTSFKKSKKGGGDWTLPQHPNLYLKFHLYKIQHLLTADRLVQVKFCDIAYVGFDLPPTETHKNCFCCQGKRYHLADTSYPGLLLENCNHFGKKYRMFDGKHRIQKMQSQGKVESNFYVFTYDDIKKYLRRVE